MTKNQLKVIGNSRKGVRIGMKPQPQPVQPGECTAAIQSQLAPSSDTKQGKTTLSFMGVFAVVSLVQCL